LIRTAQSSLTISFQTHEYYWNKSAVQLFDTIRLHGRVQEPSKLYCWWQIKLKNAVIVPI